MTFPSPTVTPPTLANWQWEYNSVTLGNETPYAVLGVEGLGGLGAAIRSGDVPLPRDFGEAKGLDLYAGRDILFDLWMHPSGLSLQAMQVQLGKATGVQPNEELPLWFQLPTLPIMCSMCRPRKREGKVDSDYASGGVWKPELALHATDSRLYGRGLSATASAESAVTGGLTFPATAPFTFGSTLPATIEAHNEGNTEMRPIAILTGPLNTPRICNASISGEPTIELARPSGEEPTIKAGDQALIDFGNPHRLLYYPGGIASGAEPEDIAQWLTFSSTWWDLLAETVNRVTFRVSSATAGTMELQWAPAWYL
jgi:hypothetical protein